MKHFLLFGLVLAGLLSACQTVPAGATAAGPMGIVGLAPAQPQAASSLLADKADWYKDQNFYHLWVAAFADSDGNGIGDLKGITGKLDYLKSLGITGLWLSPFFENASKMPNLHGYDVTNHYRVDPRFGTNADMAELLQAAHQRGLRVIFDFVPNHVSDKHPWFTDSASGLNGKRDWFLWSLDPPAEGWANWSGDAAWYDGGTDPADSSSEPPTQYYYALFWSGMPDLNYRNPEVRREMAQVARFWLDFGFDGLRADAVRYLVESPDGMTTGVSEVAPETLEYFANFRKTVLDPYTALGYPKFMIAENWTENEGSLRDFMGTPQNPIFHLMLDFGFGKLAYNSLERPRAFEADGQLMVHWQNILGGWTDLGSGSGTFLNNHDNYQSRPATQFQGDLSRARLAAALQLTGPGTPFWYYGNELDMPGKNRGDDKEFRQPMDWSRLAAAQKDPDSGWNLTRDLLQARLARPSLRTGSLAVVTTSSEVLRAYLRQLGTEKTLVVINPSDSAVSGTLGQSLPGVRWLAGSKTGFAIKNGGLEVKNLPPHGYIVLAVE